MLNSDHEPHITGTPMPHGKPQIQIGCGDSTRDQGDATRNQLVYSVYAKSALLDSNYEFIPKVFAGQPFFITQSTVSLNPTRSGRQPIPALVFRPSSTLSRTCVDKDNLEESNLTPPETTSRKITRSAQRRRRAAGRYAASHPVQYRQVAHPYPSPKADGRF